MLSLNILKKQKHPGMTSCLNTSQFNQWLRQLTKPDTDWTERNIEKMCSVFI